MKIIGDRRRIVILKSSMEVEECKVYNIGCRVIWGTDLRHQYTDSEFPFLSLDFFLIRFTDHRI